MSIQTTYSRYLAESTVRGARAAIAAIIHDPAALRSLSDSDAARRAAAGKWSPKEILGHLVDSALNNTQRFVRAQISAHLSAGALRTPGYAQNDWVRVCAYQQRPWPEIIDLWIGLNGNILHIIDNFDAASLSTPCSVGDDEPLPIEHIIIDYAGHLLHHYRQITDAR